jgi:hypothetical protein
MASAALMRRSKKACGKQHVLRIKKAYRKDTRAVLKRASHEWPRQKVISNCKQDMYVCYITTSLNMTTWGSNGWYYGPCCFSVFFNSTFASRFQKYLYKRHVCALIHHVLMILSRRWPGPPQCDSTIGVFPRFRAKLPRDLATRIHNTAFCQTRIEYSVKESTKKPVQFWTFRGHPRCVVCEGPDLRHWYYIGFVWWRRRKIILVFCEKLHDVRRSTRFGSHCIILKTVCSDFTVAVLCDRIDM